LEEVQENLTNHPGFKIRICSETLTLNSTHSGAGFIKKQMLPIFHLKTTYLSNFGNQMKNNIIPIWDRLKDYPGELEGVVGGPAG